MGDVGFVIDPATSGPAIEVLKQDDENRKVLRKVGLDLSPGAAHDVAIHRLAWIQALRQRGYRTPPSSQIDPLDIEFVARTQELERHSPQTLARWLEAFAADPRSIVPKFHDRGGKGIPRSDDRALLILREELDKVRAAGFPIRIGQVCEAARQQIRARNAAPAAHAIPEIPARTASRRLSEWITPYERDIVKLGRLKADRKHAATAARPTVDHPGLILEVDDLKSGHFCIDRRTGLVWGTAFLTMAVDQASGYLAGYALGDRYRSAQSAIECIVCAIGPKQSLIDRILPGQEWPAMGYPAGILMDNARYNDPQVLSLILEVSDLEYAKPFNPTGKREIEYYNSHVRAFEKDLPGTATKNDPESRKHAIKGAISYIDTYEREWIRWALADHANRAGNDGYSRYQRYIEANALSLRSLAIPSMERLAQLRLQPLKEPLAWGPNGLRYLGLTWQDADLYARYINREGAARRVHVSIDPTSLSHVYIRVPDSDIVLKISSTTPEYADGFPLNQQKLVVRRAREMQKTNPSFIGCVLARRALVEETAGLLKSKKMSERRRSQKTHELLLHSKFEKATTEKISALEERTFNLNQVEMTLPDESWQLPGDETW
jgi:putative transposase